MTPKFGRILLKLSGEVLAGEQGHGFDFQVIETICDAMASYEDGETAICFMGHGTEADSNGVYDQMQGVLDDMGAENYFIGTVEATPSVEDVIAAVGEGEYTRVVLEPLMIVAGDHANNDMAGDDDDSWKSIFEANGIKVRTVIRGLGEYKPVQQQYLKHIDAALEELAASKKK